MLPETRSARVVDASGVVVAFPPSLGVEDLVSAKHRAKTVVRNVEFGFYLCISIKCQEIVLN